MSRNEAISPEATAATKRSLPVTILPRRVDSVGELNASERRGPWSPGPLLVALVREDLQLGCANARRVQVEAGQGRLVAVGRVGRIVVLVALVRRSAVRSGSSRPPAGHESPSSAGRRTTSHDQLGCAVAAPRTGTRPSGLKKIVNCELCEQSTAPFASQVQTWNCRSAEKRFWPPGSFASAVLTRSIALTWTRRTWCDACDGSRRTVTCLPATGPLSEAQFVTSVSSISLSRLTRRQPTPPRSLEARLRDMLTGMSRTCPGLSENVNRFEPKPFPRATNSYVPGTIRTCPRAAWRVGVRDRRRSRLVAADEQLHGVPVRLADGLEGHRGIVGVGRLEARRRVEIGRAGAGRARPEPPSRERVPEKRLVRASKRIMSAASMASRASTMLTDPLAISSQASNTSCAQRRFPGTG